MRALFATIFFFASSVALACPNLAGTYTCSEDGQDYQTVLSQNTVNGVTTYTMLEDGDEMNIIADNNRREERTDSGYVGIKGSCQDNKLLIAIDSKETDADLGITIEINATFAVSLDADGSLESNTNGHVIINGQRQDLSESSVCTRQ